MLLMANFHKEIVLRGVRRYPFRPRFNSLRKRQSVPCAMNLWPRVDFVMQVLRRDMLQQLFQSDGRVGHWRFCDAGHRDMKCVYREGVPVRGLFFSPVHVQYRIMCSAHL